MCIIFTLFTYICSKKMVHVGKYSIHGASGLWKTIEKMVLGRFFCCQLMSSNFSYLFCFFGGVVIICFLLLTLTFSRWWFYFFMFTSSWGNVASLTDIFQMGWNHQLVLNLSKRVGHASGVASFCKLYINLIAVGATPAMCIRIKK